MSHPAAAAPPISHAPAIAPTQPAPTSSPSTSLPASDRSLAPASEPRSSDETSSSSSSSSSSVQTPGGIVQLMKCGTELTYSDTQEKVNTHFNGLILAAVDNQAAFWGLQIRSSLTWYSSSKRITSELITKACDSWDTVCGVEFKQVVREQDAFIKIRDSTRDEAIKNGNIYALAFFPGVDRKAREIIIFDALNWKNDNFKVSTIMHELGHVLGFRHEHIKFDVYINDGRGNRQLVQKAEPAQIDDKGRIIGLAEYQFEYEQPDHDSIMSYERIYEDDRLEQQSKLSQRDMIDAQRVYGLSSRLVKFI
eukprot:TRINITY_DN7631_c0_g1_i3.p1 TRINITY_DN7631_c0_g1~~TRINITY_DN7631_c0_g1_i3.p1  ORF type:complete len:308 (+),score=88.17 TRINITY_DN7631_c0_g1_i3:144-1067(+)